MDFRKLGAGWKELRRGITICLLFVPTPPFQIRQNDPIEALPLRGPVHSGGLQIFTRNPQNPRQPEHYRVVQLAVKNTFRFTLVCIPLLVVIGLMIAMPVSKLKSMGTIKSLYLFPLAMPTATIVTAPSPPS